MIILISYIAALLTLIGVMLLAHHRKFGWIISAVGSLVWIAYALVTQQPALVLINAVFLNVDAVGWCKWNKLNKLNK